MVVAQERAISRSGSSPAGSTMGTAFSDSPYSAASRGPVILWYVEVGGRLLTAGVPVGLSHLHTHPVWFAACLWSQE